MRDRIEIFELRAHTFLGVEDWERRERQEVLIGLQLFTDTREAARDDSLEHTVNYATVCARILRFAEEAHCFLVEKFAEEVARLCLQEFPLAKVRVRVEKPTAVRMARSVAIIIERQPADFSS